MDVGDERDADAASVQFGADSPQRTRVRDRGDGDADDFATGCDQADRLRDRRRHVLRGRRGHRLHTNGVLATHTDITDHHAARAAALVGVASDTGEVRRGLNGDHASLSALSDQHAAPNSSVR